MTDRGGVGIPFRKALEKGFSDMYGSWGGTWPQKKVTGGQTSTGQGFSAVSSRPGQDFDPFEVIFSGFQRQAPLKPENWGKPRPEMDSAPSK